MEIPRQGDPAETVINPEKWKELLDYYHADRKGLIGTAAYMRDQAVSYRNHPFKTGCALMAVKPGFKKGEYEVYSGYNFKPTPREERGSQKRCAERNAVDAALKDGSSLIVAMISVSKETDTENGINKAYGVLHPCQECRNMFRELMETGILRGESIICNVNDAKKSGEDTPIIEERTLKQLLELYKDDVGD